MYLHIAACKYINKLIASYERMLGSKPKTSKIKSPLVKGDHPKIDDSAFLEEEGIQQYQPLIRYLQWAMLLRRFDIGVAVMTMSDSDLHQESEILIESSKFVATFPR
jgi:hypothetical protein